MTLKVYASAFFTRSDDIGGWRSPLASELRDRIDVLGDDAVMPAGSGAVFTPDGTNPGCGQRPRTRPASVAHPTA